MRRMLSVLPGLALCAAVAAAAVALSGLVPLGAVALAILIGLAAGNVRHPGAAFAPGVGLAGTHVLSLAIALLGFRLDYALLARLGWTSLGLIVIGMAVTLTAAVLLGRALRVDPRLALLLGVGNGVCGSSAIAAAEGVIGAERDHAGIAVAVVNLLGTAGMLGLPLLGGLALRLDEVPLGILIGNTLQAVGQVTAAGFAVGDAAGQAATVVKLGRVLMLTPVLLGLAWRARRQGAAVTAGGLGVPWFIVGFVACSVIASLHVVPAPVLDALAHAGHLALVLAMAGIGLRITLASLARSGGQALTLGALVFLVQLAFSGAMAALLF